MILPEIPCIKDKCLLLPICKPKKFIYCSKLEKYYVDTRHSCKKPISTNDFIEIINHIRKTLKYIITLEQDE